LGEPEIASSWVVVYILCIGYQIRNTPLLAQSHGSRRGHGAVPKFVAHQGPYYCAGTENYDNESYLHDAIENGDTACQVQPVYPMSNPTPASIIKQQQSTASEVCQTGASNSKPSDEATLLREALASRKGFRDS
jgi:hypothetical protein